MCGGVEGGGIAYKFEVPIQPVRPEQHEEGRFDLRVLLFSSDAEGNVPLGRG